MTNLMFYTLLALFLSVFLAFIHVTKPLAAEIEPTMGLYIGGGHG